MENLVEYLNSGVELIVKQALKATLKNPMESAFILKYMKAQQKASKMRLRAETEGVHIPPFLIASIASECNLFCSGCYARANNSMSQAVCHEQLTDGDWTRIFGEASALGVSFVLLAGGEPLLRKEVIKAAATHPEVVFPVFTNGTLLDSDYISLFHKNRNLVPIMSMEGDKAQTDTRRGPGVYEKLLVVMAQLRDKGILFGVSITVTKQNLKSVTEPEYIKSLWELGCKVVIFVEYVPMAGDAAEAAPDAQDRTQLSARQDQLRCMFEDMLFVAFPGDEEAFGGCLAAGRGFFHINPRGDAEPCPFSPFSDTNLKTGTLKDALKSPLFKRLELGGYLAGEHLGGCALFGREEEIRALAKAPKR